ncbi:MAG TPA: hypothetical protein VF570_14060 [Pyrinomonadaceae bacterium]
MRREVEDEQIIRRYLLDDLTSEERRRLEERLLDDGDDFYDQLQLAEAELADDYVTGDLSEDERARFKQSFLSTPGRYEQLRFTELLRGHFAADEPLKKTVTDEVRPSPSWPQRLALLLGLGQPAVGFALACGLILAVAAAALLGVRAWQLNRTLEQLRAQQTPAPVSADAAAQHQRQLEEETARRDSIAQELARERERRAGLEQEVAQLREGGRGEKAARPPTEHAAGRPEQPTPRGSAGTVLALLLTSGAVRESGEQKTLALTPEAATVRLRLDVAADDYKGFRAALQDADGKSLLTRGGLSNKSARAGSVVIFDVPARLLREGGDFQVQLSGVTRQNVVEEIGRYYFRVVRP